MRCRAGGWLWALALAGCGAELDDGRAGDFVAVEPSAPVVGDGGLDGGGPDAEARALTVDDYVGVWAHVQIQRGLAVLPVLGAEPTTAYGVMRMGIEAGPEAGALALTVRICEVRIERERDVVTTEIPPSFVEALIPVTRPATFAGDRFEAPTFVELRAVALDDPANDALPTAGDDPRVIDLDGDGHPGLTARVSGLVDGEVYVVQRAITALAGQNGGTGTLDGLLTWSAEESIVGADDPLLEDGAPFEPDPDPGASVFLSTRLETDRDCDWIVANQDLLFAR